MFTKKRLALFGVFICTLPLLMAPSGGFPSRPTFQSVGVGKAPASQAGRVDAQAAAGSFSQIQSRGAGGSNSIGICMSDAAAVCSTSAAGGDGVLFSSGTMRLTTVSGTDLATLSASGLTVGANAVRSGAFQRIAYAWYTGVGASCGLQATANTGVTSCTRNSTGNYSYNLTAAGFTAQPTCMGSINGFGLISLNSSSTTAAGSLVRDPTGATPTDLAHYILCFGT